MLQGFDHILAFALGVDRSTDLSIPEPSDPNQWPHRHRHTPRLLQKADVTAVQHVKASADKNFFPAHKINLTTDGLRWTQIKNSSFQILVCRFQLSTFRLLLIG